MAAPSRIGLLKPTPKLLSTQKWQLGLGPDLIFAKANPYKTLQI